MRKIDRSYFAKRAAQELAAAERANSTSAARIHRELALRYSVMSEGQHASAGAEASA
jgi:hypothetical protein